MERNETVMSAAPMRPASAAAIDWRAILAGVVMAAALAGLFATFGAALGFSTISPEPGEGSFDFWVIVTAVWSVISLLVSYLAGGYVTGRMRQAVGDVDANEVNIQDGLHGLVVWGLGMILTAWMAAGAIGGLSSALGTATEAAGSAIGGAAAGVAQYAGSSAGMTDDAEEAAPDDGGVEGVLDYFNSILMRPDLTRSTMTDEAGMPLYKQDTAQLNRQTGFVLAKLLRTGDISDADRDFLVEATATQSGQSRAEAEARVDEAVTGVRDARSKAEEMAKQAKQKAIDAAETARISAILSSFLLTAAALIAAAAAVSGAVRGGRHRNEGRIFGGFRYRM